MKAPGGDKTNALRLLDAAGAEYQTHAYDPELTNGACVAQAVGIPPERVFKTLVTQGASRRYYVFVVPVEKTLHLKKAALSVDEKSVAMIPQKELFPLTGYVHGGCSPLGMKKAFVTRVDETAQLFDGVCVSAGRRGLQMELAPDVLLSFAHASYADLTE